MRKMNLEGGGGVAKLACDHEPSILTQFYFMRTNIQNTFQSSTILVKAAIVSITVLPVEFEWVWRLLHYTADFMKNFAAALKLHQSRIINNDNLMAKVDARAIYNCCKILS